MKDFFNKLLTGVSIGIVVALIPNALVGEIFKLFVNDIPFLQTLTQLTLITMSMLPILIGVTVGMTFKLTPIQTASVGLAAMVGSGVITIGDSGAMTLAGIGVVLNTTITAGLAVYFVQLIGQKLKDYTILLMPILSIFIPGLIGFLILPFVQSSTGLIGEAVTYVTNLQPIVMGSVIAVIFCVLILSPISTVGVATVIMLSGIGAGAANLGVVAAGVGLCIASYKSNSLGTALAHVLGSPKIQMRNFFMKPRMALPMVLTAAILGAGAGLLNIQGTPMSAGFGLSGLVGPLNFINLTSDGWVTTNIVIMIALFFILPILLNIVFIRIFQYRLKWTKADDYKITIE